MLKEEQEIYVEIFDNEKTYKGLKSFDCGDDVINKYVKENLKKQAFRRNTRAFVLVDGDDNLIGFVTASLFQLTKEQVPSKMYLYSLPPRVGVIKIPMLAVDKKYQRKKWGSYLMGVALEYVIEASDIVPDIKGAYLDAKKDAVDFYKDLSFEVIDEQPSEYNTFPMFISIDTLRSIKTN